MPVCSGRAPSAQLQGSEVNSLHRGWVARFAALAAACGSMTSTATVYAQESTTAVLEEVVVTGTRLQTAGFNAPTPVTVVGAEVIQQRAPANIADVINEQPAFRIAQSDTTRNTLALPQFGQNTIDLRALGSNRTLTLINGHRAVATNWTGTVDTNIVPVGLVERIEVVTGGASAAYGSDAVAGVTNIILRDKMQGLSGNLQTGLTEFGSGQQYTASLAGGTAFAGDRANVIVGIDYNKSEAIKNAYGTKWGRAEIGTIQPGGTGTTGQRGALGLPQQVITTNVQPGTSAPGGLLYQNTTTGLAYTFDANGNPVPFSQGTLWGTQQFMTGSSANTGYNLGNVAWLRLPTSRLDAYGRLSYEMTDRMTAFLEISNSSNKIGPFKQNDIITAAGTGAPTPALTISRTNPFVTPATLALIPAAAQTLSIGRINTEIGDGGTFVRQEVDSRRIVAGLEGEVLDDWNWEVYYQTGKTTLDFKRNDLMFPALQKAVNGCADITTGLNAEQRTNVALYESVTGKTCTPFNPFGVARTPAAASYFTHPTRQVQDIEQNVAAASLSGSPFAVPAGDVAFAVGAEYRREHIVADSDSINELRTLLVANLVEFTGGYDVKEGFMEVGIPVVKDLAFARSLDLNAAVRRTDYELSGPVTTWKAGLTWEPTDFLRARFTRSRDIRAPNYFELFLVGGRGSANVINRIPSGVVGRNGTVNSNPAGISNTASLPVFMIGSGGGTGLEPEIADTTTGGLVFQQGGFRASVDYYEVKVAGAIASPGAQGEIDLCRDGVVSHCQNIIFNSTVAGGIELVEHMSANLNTQTVSGYDFEVAYRRPMLFGLGGNLTLRALVNHAPHNKTFNPIQQTVTGLGQTTENSNTVNAQPKWGYNLSVGYEVDRLDFSLQFRGFGKRRGNPLIYNSDGSLSTNTILGPEDAGYVVTNNNTINKNRFSGQTIVNTSVNFRLNDNFSIFGNIDNVFDAEPPALSTSNVYDLIGRRYRAGVRFSML